jgi:hydroxymethylpyrimidine pyrophosphatase-like HAD family hydrolase
MTSPIRLIVTDLDGTLWESPKLLPSRTLAALDRLARQGVTVLVATARRAGVTRQLLRMHGLTLPAVLLDGALLRTASWDVLHAESFDSASAASILGSTRLSVVDGLGFCELGR